MSELADFLAEYVEGYLIQDLRTMCGAEPACSDASAGALGNPLVMTTFSGIELLGALISPKRFESHGQGDTYFAAYWRNHLYATDRLRQDAGPALYQLMRHGLAHSFLVKGAITICKHNPNWHLVRGPNGTVYVDSAQLAVDFIASYQNGIKSWSGTESRAREVQLMAQRLREIRQTYTKQASPLANLKLPSADAIVIHVGPPGFTTASFSSGPALQIPPMSLTSKGIGSKG